MFLVIEVFGKDTHAEQSREEKRRVVELGERGRCVCARGESGSVGRGKAESREIN